MDIEKMWHEATRLYRLKSENEDIRKVYSDVNCLKIMEYCETKRAAADALAFAEQLFDRG